MAFERIGRAALVMLLCAGGAATAWAGGFEQFENPPMARPALTSALALQASTITGFDDAPKKPRKPKTPGEHVADEDAGLGADRARILLRSLTIPGWGQATLGHRKSAAVFGIVETGAWTAFTAFRIQQQMRTNSFQRTARLYAGIDLKGRDEEFFRTIGNFLSSEEYNLLVVSRDAANIYLRPDAPADLVGYREYIAKNSIGGANAWTWSDIGSLLRYRDQRKDAQRAGLRANTALAVAVGNRLLSALHAARLAGQASAGHTSLRLDLTPHPDDPAGFHAGVRADF